MQNKEFETIKNIIKVDSFIHESKSTNRYKKQSFGLKITTKTNIYKIIFVNCQLVEDITINSMDISNIYHIDFFKTDKKS